MTTLVAREAVETRNITERGSRVFAHDEIFDSHGRSLLLNETRELNALTLRDTADGISVQALGWIGYLPMTPTIAVNIQPKFSVNNLWRLLEMGGENYGRILSVARQYQRDDSPAPTALLVRSFCHYLRDALNEGLMRDYRPREVDGYFRSRVDFGKTVSRYLSRGDAVHTSSVTFQFGPDGPANQAVKDACLAFVHVIPAGEMWNEERKLILLALNNLEGVRHTRTTQPVEELEREIPQRLRASYVGMLRIFELFRTGGGIGYTYDGTGVEFHSFLFNLDGVFEQYIRNVLAEACPTFGLSATDGNVNRHQGQLFTDSKRFKTKTDIIFKDLEGTVVCLGEVKYKPKLSEDDRYQIISHTVSRNSKLGVLISPAVEGQKQGFERLGFMPNGSTFWHYRYDLEADLSKSERRLIDDLMDKINSDGGRLSETPDTP